TRRLVTQLLLAYARAQRHALERRHHVAGDAGAAADDVQQARQQRAAAGQVDLVDASVRGRGVEKLDRTRDFERGVFEEGSQYVVAVVVGQVAVLLARLGFLERQAEGAHDVLGQLV